MKKIIATVAVAAFGFGVAMNSAKAIDGSTSTTVDLTLNVPQSCSGLNTSLAPIDFGPNLVGDNVPTGQVVVANYLLGAVTCNLPGARIGIKSSNNGLTLNGSREASAPYLNYVATVHGYEKSATLATDGGSGIPLDPAYSDIMNSFDAVPFTLDIKTVGSAQLAAGDYRDTLTIKVGSAF